VDSLPLSHQGNPDWKVFEEWKFQRVLQKGLGLGGGVEELESRSLGNSEGIRINHAFPWKWL